MKQFLNLYRNIGVVRPEWTAWQKLKTATSGFLCFFHHRYDTFLYLLNGHYPYATKVHGKKILDRHYTNGGAIFFSIHSGPYPLVAEILRKRHSGEQLVVPFYRENTISTYPLFRRIMSRIGISVIALGGAMQKIDPVLSNGGSACLFLDAVLPLRHTSNLKLFEKEVPVSTGAMWLAKKFQKPIIPVYSRKTNGTVELVVLKPIEFNKRPDDEVMNDIGSALETMISDNISQWHVMDRFLLRN